METAIAPASAVDEKIRDLCQAILDRPDFAELRRRIDAFMADEKANSVLGKGGMDLLPGLLGNQLKAVALTIVWSVVATAIIAYIVKAVVGLRPSEEVEVNGLDLAEHGEEGYHG